MFLNNVPKQWSKLIALQPCEDDHQRVFADPRRRVAGCGGDHRPTGGAAASPENHFVLLNASTGTCHWWLERVGFLLHVLPKTATRRAETIEPRLKHMMKDGGGKAQRDSRGHEESIRLGASSEARPHAGGSIAASTAFVQASAH